MIVLLLQLLSAGHYPALVGRDETVLGQRAAGRVTAIAARVAVKHLTLLAEYGGLAPRRRSGLAQLAHRPQRPPRLRLDELVDDILHGPVARQILRPVLVKVHRFPTCRTAQRVGHLLGRRRRPRRRCATCEWQTSVKLSILKNVDAD